MTESFRRADARRYDDAPSRSGKRQFSEIRDRSSANARRHADACLYEAPHFAFGLRR